MSRVRTVGRHHLRRAEDRVELALVRKTGLFGGYNVQEGGRGPNRLLSGRWTREDEAKRVLHARLATLQSLGFLPERVGVEEAAVSPKSDPNPNMAAPDWDALIRDAIEGPTPALRQAIAAERDREGLAQALGLPSLALDREPSRATAKRLAAVLRSLHPTHTTWAETWMRSRSVLLELSPTQMADWLAKPGPWETPLAKAITDHGPALLGIAGLELVAQAGENTAARAAQDWLSRLEFT